MAKLVATPSSRRPPSGPPSGPRRGVDLNEPPAFRTSASLSSAPCVDCGRPPSEGSVAPRCWGCGRVLCDTCFWHHSLTPANHRCVRCSALDLGPTSSISGGRAGTITPLGSAGAVSAH